MKTFTILVCMLIGISASAQAPAFNIITEEVTIAEPAFSEIQSATGGLPHTIRVYANFPEDYELQVVYGNLFNPMSLGCVNGFYQHAQGGPTTVDISSGTFGLFPALEYDSWMTIGYLDNVDNTLLTAPLDGSFYNTWESGADLLVNDLIGGALTESSLPMTFPPNTPEASGNVLIAQLTGTSDISGCLNFQIRRLNPDGTIYDPPGAENTETWVYNDVCFNHNFVVGPPGCVGDFDGNGVIATADLLLFIPDLGCTANCAKDLTGDDVVSITDVLIFLGIFGTICP